MVRGGSWGHRHPRDIAAALGEQGIFVWNGNYYALAVTERLSLEDKGGMVRVGAVHYNTVKEIRRLGEVLRGMALYRHCLFAGKRLGRD